MYRLIVPGENSSLPTSISGASSLDIDNYLALEGLELIQSAARILMKEPYLEIDIGTDEEYNIIEEPRDCRVVTQYINSCISIVIGCVRAFGAVQIDLNTLSISNRIDPSVESSIVIIKES